jgi:metal-responsive CopG/Arc/MetJ family transcriptional regulator
MLEWYNLLQRKNWRQMMSTETPPVRKITISLPSNLVEFADRKAARLNVSRSGLIARVLSDIKAAEEKQLAAEGYRFYAQEASEFAEASASAVAESLGNAS